MAPAATSPVSWVRAPDDSATGVRELLELIGKPRNRPDATFASPSAMSS